MKHFIILAGLISSGSAMAQDDNVKPPLPEVRIIDSVNLKDLFMKNLLDRSALSKKNWILKDSNSLGKIYALPQGNMPCIVPDMDDFKRMPSPGRSLNSRPPTDPQIYIHRTAPVWISR